MPRQVWQADDGTQFEDEKACLLYERFFKHLCTRSIPEELRFLPQAKTNQLLAKNFYEVLNTASKCLSFLESVEEEAAPDEMLLNDEKYKMRREAEIEGRINNSIAEVQSRFAEDIEKYKQVTVIEILSKCEIQGDSCANYWKNIFELKEEKNDPNYALIAAFFESFHKGEVSHRKMFDELIKKINVDEILSIFRDIEFNHKKFAWGT